MPITATNLPDVIGNMIAAAVPIPAGVVFTVSVSGSTATLTATAQVNQNFTASTDRTLAQVMGLSNAALMNGLRTAVNDLLQNIGEQVSQWYKTNG